ncbi:MAG: hypothetical protein Q7S69_09620 [Nitrosomonadaceae bacterium]|nr:hypothetical protein [Nitrosomonadaceae bacterium]
MPEPDSDYAKDVIRACVEHGRTLLGLQLPKVEAKNYDFSPQFQRMTTELYLVGVMWRYGEQFDLPTNARDRAFICLMHMLISDGASWRAAKRRIRVLNSYSRDKNGEDALAVHIGYEAGDREGALAAIFDQFRNVPEAGGAPYRLLERSKPIAGVIAVAGLAIALLIGRSWEEALGVGLVAGFAVLAIATLIFRQMTKSGQRTQ